MANVIKHKRSSTPSAVPSAGVLSEGELAINLVDKKLYSKDASGNVIVIAEPAVAASVTTTNTVTLTNKTIEAGTFTNGYTEEYVTANTSTAYTIDLANGSVQILTLTGNCVYTFPTVAAGKSFLLIQKQDGTGSRTVTWPSVTNPVKWPGGTAPTITSTASKADIFAFTSDGTNWIGRTIAQNYTL